MWPEKSPFGIMGYIRDRLDAIDKKHAHHLSKRNGGIVTGFLIAACPSGSSRNTDPDPLNPLLVLSIIRYI